MIVSGTGPTPARIMIVGEAPGEEEERHGVPFIGNSGEELTNMLHDAGIVRAECYITNVCKIRPRDNDIETFFVTFKKRIPGQPILDGVAELQKEVERVQPNLIIAFGNLSLWALTGHWGVTTWRGSLLQAKPEFGRVKVLPTLHPAYILRQWHQRFVAVQDLRRAKREAQTREFTPPTYNFVIRPEYSRAIEILRVLTTQASAGPLRIAADIETRGNLIACVGIAWSRRDALCIPLMCVETPTGYWSLPQEFELVKHLRALLTHPNVQVVGQNWLYDLQYISKFWGFSTQTYMDTMLAHHVCWPGTQKSLDFLASLYCEHYVYWKDDGKTWDRNVPEEQLWVYNCTDCIRTYEVSEALDSSLNKLNLRAQFNFQMRLLQPSIVCLPYDNLQIGAVEVNVNDEHSRIRHDETSEVRKFEPCFFTPFA